MRANLVGFLISIAMTFAGSLAHAQTFTTLHSFDGTDGFPNSTGASLVQGANGDLYGTTSYGGSHGGGTVFRITQGGRFKSIYNFCSLASCADGNGPYASLLLASNGDFYGTTVSGGAHGADSSSGTVFKITPGGVLTTLYSFCTVSGSGTPGDPPCLDGTYPGSALIKGADGDLYGTTIYGGPYGAGTVFRISLGGALTTLYSFCALASCPDGSSPGGLVAGNDGNFYGTTEFGGAGSVGTVFKITPAGELTTIHDFCVGSNSVGGLCVDGKMPYDLGSLTVGGDGFFYGTTLLGGVLAQNGVVFEITTTGELTVIADAGCASTCPPGSATIGGAGPGPLIEGSDGNFYGATFEGGTLNYGGGEIFEVSAVGVSNLYTIPCVGTPLPVPCDSPGDYPSGFLPSYGALVQATDGDFYGLLQNGGATYNSACPAGCGAIFRYSTGLGPFVRTGSSAGLVEAAVSIFGTDLTGATSVTFNGTAASFVVKSATEITTRVPAGATTGTVQVVTPGATLNSNVPYTVQSKTATPAFRPAAAT
jgi:uncharacterized repeat protein (TIGR03803 family)